MSLKEIVDLCGYEVSTPVCSYSKFAQVQADFACSAELFSCPVRVTIFRQTSTLVLPKAILEELILELSLGRDGFKPRTLGLPSLKNNTRMPDIFDKKTRSRIMSCVQSKNTTPELRLRKALFAKGLRYRIHVSKMPGKPDIVFPGRRAAIFVHGCQWHWHGCARSRMPSTNVEYWETKIQRNRDRDIEHLKKLSDSGWRVLVVWECSIKVKQLPNLADRIAWWVIHGVGDAAF